MCAWPGVWNDCLPLAWWAPVDPQLPYASPDLGARNLTFVPSRCNFRFRSGTAPVGRNLGAEAVARKARIGLAAIAVGMRKTSLIGVPARF